MKHIKSAWVWFSVIVIYLVGVVGFMVPALHDIFIWLIPINIIFAFAVLILGEEKITYSKLVLFLICFLFGYVLEFAGTETGVIFGEYKYGNALGIKVLDVPLLIGVNWFFMVYSSLALSSQITKSKTAQIFLAPLFMVAYDFFLEPFAIKNDMWSWANDTVPLQNYIAWYIGGLFLSFISVQGKFDIKNRFATGLYFVQLFFFVILFIWDKLHLF